LARRQASEQYFTSAQFLAQLRRQLMARPHRKQGLLGSAALLPRNETLRNVIALGDWQCAQLPGCRRFAEGGW
jgi:hypothetical protein